MYKIALLIPNLHSGGSERIVSRLSIKLCGEKSEYEVYLILFDAKSLHYDFGGELIDLNLPAKDRFFKKTINILRRIYRIRMIVKQKKIDLVLSFTSAANNANAFSFAKCKKIISCRGFNHLKKNHKLYKLLCNLTDGILFNSYSMKNYYLNIYNNDKNKVFTLYNLFDNSNIQSLSNEEIEENEKKFFDSHKVVTTVSRFCYDKGQWNLLKAFEVLKEKIPDAGLVFVGNSGEYEERIKEMASKSKHSKDILFVGFQRNPFKYVSKSKVYVLCSLTEGFPNSLVEAMICKTPVVATNCPTGPSEILFKEFKNDIEVDKMIKADFGILTPRFKDNVDYDYNNIEAEHIEYAKALEIILTNDELANEYRNKAFEMSKKFDEENIINEYIDLIERLIKR